MTYQEVILTVGEVLARFEAGPQTGVFTDGSSRPNPGPGGWGVVLVDNGEVVQQAHGSDPDTTNNRMELTALIEGIKLLDSDSEQVLYTDSDLCVKTITIWAKGWEKNGWKRKSGPVRNLELVQELYELYNERPQVELKWIKAHNGWLWNEYADSLSTAWLRDEL